MHQQHCLQSTLHTGLGHLPPHQLLELCNGSTCEPVPDTCLHASESVKPEDSSRALRIPAAWLALQHVQAWYSWQTGSRPALLGSLYGWDRGKPTCTGSTMMLLLGQAAL